MSSSGKTDGAAEARGGLFAALRRFVASVTGQSTPPTPDARSAFEGFFGPSARPGGEENGR